MGMACCTQLKGAHCPWSTVKPSALPLAAPGLLEMGFEVFSKTFVAAAY